MKVKEAIEQLSKLDGELALICFGGDEDYHLADGFELTNYSEYVYGKKVEYPVVVKIF